MDQIHVNDYLEDGWLIKMVLHKVIHLRNLTHYTYLQLYIAILTYLLTNLLTLQYSYNFPQYGTACAILNIYTVCIQQVFPRKTYLHSGSPFLVQSGVCFCFLSASLAVLIVAAYSQLLKL